MDLTQQQETQRYSLPPSYSSAAAEAGEPAEAVARGLFESAVRGLELVLRRYQKIYEFAEDEKCIFRIALGTAEDDIVLRDGTHVRPGEPILELHLWNEHLPAIPREGPRIAWGLTMRRRAIHSFALLAAHIERERAYDGISALRGEAAFGSRLGRAQMRRVARRYGFELFEDEPPLLRRFRFFWENFLIWGLVWTFNPGGLRGKRLIKERFELWISRTELLRRFGRSPPPPTAARPNGEAEAQRKDAAPARP